MIIWKSIFPKWRRLPSNKPTVTTRKKRVVGYYSLAFGSILHEDATQKIKDELPQYPIPIILLARLAVDVKEKGQGLGRGLMRDVLLRTVQAADIGGLRAMLTHAKDEDAKSFYENYGFESSPTNELHLMLSIKNIRANLIYKMKRYDFHIATFI